MTQQLNQRAEIVRKLAPRNLFQPATALWRVYEIEAIWRHVLFGGRVVDVGCGDGSLAQVVFGEGVGRCEFVGVEPDSVDAGAAERSGVYSRVHNTPGDRIPEADGSFDLAFSNSVLEHIPAVESVLAEVGRLLKPHGRFAFTVPSEQFHACLRKRGVLPALAWLRGESATEQVDRRLQHHRYWSPQEWEKALGAAGMAVESVHRYFPKPAVQAWERWSNRTGGLAYELFRRRTGTRTIQRRLGLDWMDRLVPGEARATVLERLLRNELAFDPEATESGGLLVIARKVPATAIA
jgi:SAM-dependent methyltransferase